MGIWDLTNLFTSINSYMGTSDPNYFIVSKIMDFYSVLIYLSCLFAGLFGAKKRQTYTYLFAPFSLYFASFSRIFCLLIHFNSQYSLNSHHL